MIDSFPRGFKTKGFKLAIFIDKQDGLAYITSHQTAVVVYGRPTRHQLTVVVYDSYKPPAYFGGV